MVGLEGSPQTPPTVSLRKEQTPEPEKWSPFATRINSGPWILETYSTTVACRGLRFLLPLVREIRLKRFCGFPVSPAPHPDVPLLRVTAATSQRADLTCLHLCSCPRGVSFGIPRMLASRAHVWPWPRWSEVNPLLLSQSLTVRYQATHFSFFPSCLFLRTSGQCRLSPPAPSSLG